MLKRLITLLAVLTGLAAIGTPAHAEWGMDGCAGQVVTAEASPVEIGSQLEACKFVSQTRPANAPEARFGEEIDQAGPLSSILIGIDRAHE